MVNTMKRTSSKLLMLALLVGIVALCNFCKDEMEGKVFLTSDELMIDDYITEKDPSMSLFLDIADRADMRGMIHAYGVYTAFIPTNDGVERYLQQLEPVRSSVNDLTVEECQRIIKYHVVRHEGVNAKSLRSEDFVDGRLPQATMLAKYLTTRLAADGRTTRVNRQADIISSTKDKAVANGCIHKIDNVLIPPAATCGEIVRDSLPDEYSLFKQVLEHTGWTTKLIEDRADLTWYTVFLHNNAAFATVDVHSIEELADYLWSYDEDDRIHRGKLGELVRDTSVLNSIRANATKEIDLEDGKEVALWIFAAYHCVKYTSPYYAADLMVSPSLLTSALNQAITCIVSQGVVLLNEYVSTYDNEQGVPINTAKQSEYTDMSCYNGVLIDVNGYIGPQSRKPRAIFWEVTDQPEFRKHPSYRRASFNVTEDDVKTMSEMKVTFQPSITFNNGGGNQGTLYYQYIGDGSGVRGHGGMTASPNYEQYTFGDALGISFNHIARIDLTMPLLTPGKYYVWVGWRRADVNACRVKATYMEGADSVGIEVGSVGFHEYFITGTDPMVLLAQGMKRYTAKQRTTRMNCRRWGMIEVKSTGRHVLRLDVVERGRHQTTWIDQIQFIPIDDDQLWPRFDTWGVPVYKGTPCGEINPKLDACADDNDDR